MAERPMHRGLHLVTPRRATLSKDAFVSQTGPQTALFPSPRPGVLVFVYVSDATEEELRDALHVASPGLVVELRNSPRFDIGKFNRQRFFAYMDEQRATYLDLAVSGDSTVWSELLVERLQRAFRRATLELKRPLMFFLGTKEADSEVPKKILQTLAAVRADVLEVHEVPRFLST